MADLSSNFFEAVRRALGCTQVELGQRIGISRRTAQRWTDQGTPGYGLPKLADVVYPRDPRLAAQIAAHTGTTLEAMGIVKSVAPLPEPLPAPSPAPPPLPDGIVDAVVCVAAEVMELEPRRVRPGLCAAFARAGELGLTVEFVERALRDKLQLKVPPVAAAVAPAAAALAKNDGAKNKLQRKAKEGKPK